MKKDLTVPAAVGLTTRYARTGDTGTASPSPSPTPSPGTEAVVIPAIGLAIGVIIGLLLQAVPVWLQPYLPIAVIAALDAVFGAVRAILDGIFDDKVFVVSFLSNVVVAALIVFLGDKLGVGAQLSTGVVVVLGCASSPTSRRSGATCSTHEVPGMSTPDPDPRAAAPRAPEARGTRRARPSGRRRTTCPRRATCPTPTTGPTPSRPGPARRATPSAPGAACCAPGRRAGPVPTSWR